MNLETCFESCLACKVTLKLVSFFFQNAMNWLTKSMSTCHPCLTAPMKENTSVLFVVSSVVICTTNANMSWLIWWKKIQSSMLACKDSLISISSRIQTAKNVGFAKPKSQFMFENILLTNIYVWHQEMSSNSQCLKIT